MYGLALLLITIAMSIHQAIMINAHDTHYIGDYGIQCNVENETQELDPWAYLTDEYTDDPDGIFDLCLSYYCVDGYVVAKQRFLSDNCAEPVDDEGWKLYHEQASLRAKSPTARPNTTPMVAESTARETINEPRSALDPKQNLFERPIADPQPTPHPPVQSTLGRLVNARSLSRSPVFGPRTAKYSDSREDPRSEYAPWVYHNHVGTSMDEPFIDSHLGGEIQRFRWPSLSQYDQLQEIPVWKYAMFSLLCLSMICSLAIMFRLRRINRSASHDLSNLDV